jgi:GNAT superfamily N-acetyltransferase
VSASLRFTLVLTPQQLAEVERLAREIWFEYYVPLIGRAQVDYMLERFQSMPAMQGQIAEGYEYFLIERAKDTGAPGAIGYLAIRPDLSERALFLSKLYVLAAERGTGAGRWALTFVETVARSRGLQRVWLTVNKGNPARFVYERLGYARVADVVTDIGGGFVMDDYRMEKFLG